MEEKKKMEEQLKKEAEIKRKREEKQMALTKELMKQNQIKHLLEIRNKADNHYRIQLMKKCLCPWIEFTHTMKQSLVVAMQRHSVIMMATVWRVWFVEYRDRIANKNSIADSFHSNTLLVRSIKQWKQVCHICYYGYMYQWNPSITGTIETVPTDLSF